MNNKRLFKWYKNRKPTTHVDNRVAKYFDLFINRHKIEVRDLIREPSFDAAVNLPYSTLEK